MKKMEGRPWLLVLLLLVNIDGLQSSDETGNDFHHHHHRELKERAVLPDSVSTWLSSAVNPGGKADIKNGMISKVERRTAPIDGGATIVYTPNALQRGEYHLDTTMSCIGWRETVGCDPYNAVVSTKPASCNYNVDNTRSGYCECQVSKPSGPIVRVGHTTCGHASFRCHDICKLPPKRQCKGFTLMDTCDPLPAGHGAGGGWDFLNSKATTCNVNIHNVPLGSVPSCWSWEPLSSQIQCHEVINSTSAGYCECGSALLRPEASESGGATRVRLECGHTPLSCAYICNSDPVLQQTVEASPHMPKDRYVAAPPSYLAWSWHARPGIWNSLQSDFTMTMTNNNDGSPLINNMAPTFWNGKRLLNISAVGVLRGLEYQQHCEDAFSLGGHGAGGAGCIGKKPKWTLSLVSFLKEEEEVNNAYIFFFEVFYAFFIHCFHLFLVLTTSII
jgi:hypothetical protein